MSLIISHVTLEAAGIGRSIIISTSTLVVLSVAYPRTLVNSASLRIQQLTRPISPIVPDGALVKCAIDVLLTSCTMFEPAMKCPYEHRIGQYICKLCWPSHRVILTYLSIVNWLVQLSDCGVEKLRLGSCYSFFCQSTVALPVKMWEAPGFCQPINQAFHKIILNYCNHQISHCIENHYLRASASATPLHCWQNDDPAIPTKFTTPSSQTSNSSWRAGYPERHCPEWRIIVLSALSDATRINDPKPWGYSIPLLSRSIFRNSMFHPDPSRGWPWTHDPFISTSFKTWVCAWFVVQAVNPLTEFDIVYPANHNKQRDIADGFLEISAADFGCCAGAIDGILIQIHKYSDKDCATISGCDSEKFYCGKKLLNC